MTDCNEAISRIEAAIRDTLVEEAKNIPLQIFVDSTHAVIDVNGITTVVLSYPKPSTDEDDLRTLKIDWLSVGPAKTTNPHLRVVGRILSNAGLLEAKICWSEINELLDEIQ